jgi:hypothetical protein
MWSVGVGAYLLRRYYQDISAQVLSAPTVEHIIMSSKWGGGSPIMRYNIGGVIWIILERR